VIDARFAQALDLHLGQVLVALEDDFARLLVDDVVRGDFADELVHLDGKPVDLRLAELLDRGLGELGVLLHQHFAADADVAGRSLAGEDVELDRLRELRALLEEDGLGRVEVVEKVLVEYPRAGGAPLRASCGAGRCARR